jgi:S1-C subfamily serine protease
VRAGIIVLSALVVLACVPSAFAGDAEGGFPAVVEKVQAGTVMIEARGRDVLHFGSGFFLESPEVVVTAYHVVERARRIRVAIPNTFLTSDALLLSGSPEWDVAVLRVSWPEEVDFPGLRLSSAESLLPVGTEVAYTGYGFGTGEAFIKILSTYRGIVSSRVPHGESYLYHLSGLVNRGLSGSALYLPESGEVVGVVTRLFGPPGIGMGFGGAVPSRVIKKLTAGVRK